MTAERYKTIIESWMRSTLHEGGIDRYDDLHIDQIDKKWKVRTHWISEGLKALDLALEIRDQCQYAVTVALAFSLNASNVAKDFDYNTQEQLEADFDHTPPSLYLFRRGEEPWARERLATSPGVQPQEIDRPLVSIHTRHTRSYYLQFQQEGFGEYNRSLFIAG